MATAKFSAIFLRWTASKEKSTSRDPIKRTLINYTRQWEIRNIFRLSIANLKRKLNELIQEFMMCSMEFSIYFEKCQRWKWPVDKVRCILRCVRWSISHDWKKSGSTESLQSLSTRSSFTLANVKWQSCQVSKLLLLTLTHVSWVFVSIQSVGQCAQLNKKLKNAWWKDRHGWHVLTQ